MLIRIDENRTSPIFAQVAAEIRRAIASGDVHEGERLPPVRTLAESLDLNMHTVAKAYRELEADGLIELRQGRGASVKSGGARRARTLAAVAGKVIAEAKKHGITPSQLAALAESIG